MVNTDDCELWALAISTKGYGRIQIKQNGNWTMRQAHRVLYEAEFGELPKHLVIDHLCRIPRCINLQHLEPVTNAENIRRGEFKRKLITHCPLGHEYTPGNTLRTKIGTRRCRECNKRWCDEQYQRRKVNKVRL